MKTLNGLFILLLVILLTHSAFAQDKKPQISGIYPHLASYNNEGECGTGAVVPWAGKLWVITYGPHKPFGSSDKLYQIDSNLNLVIRKESIGGTPANRMIHDESNQLFIGPYAIDLNGNIRTIPVKEMPGRLTGTARHLTDPANKIYHGTMEEGFYEVNIHDLSVNTLYTDRNVKAKKGQKLNPPYANIAGDHGKGLYSGQGVLVFSNNGELSSAAMKEFDATAGVLAEWDGKQWKVIRRNQFVEVTGPGGIHGNANPATDPIWATGWDHKSLLLGVRDHQTGWQFYRLPKASHSYDGAHGWNTEWPRIRNIGTSENPDYLMTMHGMFWRFPSTFTSKSTAGIRPRSAYLKVIGDYCRWNNQLVFGCDDSANKEFLNKRKAKGTLEGPGQSNSNLWFTSLQKPDQLGPTTAEGAIWISEEVKANTPSEPFFFSGWDYRSCWINNEGNEDVTYSFSVDQTGTGQWILLREETVKASTSAFIVFNSSDNGEWIKVTTNKNTKATVHFTYSDNDTRGIHPAKMFKGLANVSESKTNAGLLWALGNNKRTLGVLAGQASNNGFVETGYYELNSALKLVKKEDTATARHIREKMNIPKQVVSIDEASVLIIDDKGRRWRLPKGNTHYTSLTQQGLLRICREVATERDLFNVAGTFYELPAENADGFAKIRPITSHNYRIHDYASYRGLLIMTGLQDKLPKNDEHIIQSEDGKVALWAGTIDDLWQMGKPRGEGGPLYNTAVQANTPSDPYLIGFYNERTLTLSHDSKAPVTFTIEVEPIGHGPWMNYKEITVAPGEKQKFTFPKAFQSRWIRFKTNKACKATTWLEYK